MRDHHPDLRGDPHLPGRRRGGGRRRCLRAAWGLTLPSPPVACARHVLVVAAHPPGWRKASAQYQRCLIFTPVVGCTIAVLWRVVGSVPMRTISSSALRRWVRKPRCSRPCVNASRGDGPHAGRGIGSEPWVIHSSHRVSKHSQVHCASVHGTPDAVSCRPSRRAWVLPSSVWMQLVCAGTTSCLSTEPQRGYPPGRVFLVTLYCASKGLAGTQTGALRVLIVRRD